jgi:hypothetical protein
MVRGNVQDLCIFVYGKRLLPSPVVEKLLQKPVADGIVLQ